MNALPRALRRRLIEKIAIAVLLIALVPAAHPVVRRHDRPDDLYLVSADAFPFVVDIALPRGAGTLIAPQWVATAAHVVEHIALPHSVVVDGRRVGVCEIRIYPGGGVGKNDIALLRLARPVPHVAPIALDRGDARPGTRILIAGRGQSGDGKAGIRGRDRRFRVAENRIDSTTERWLVFSFDAPPAAMEREGISGPGDSGGPALIEQEGRYLLAGISSGQDDRAAGGEGRYGAIEYYVRVAAFVDWIAAEMASVPDDCVDAPTRE